MGNVINQLRKTADVICKILSVIITVLTMIMVIIMFSQVSYRIFWRKGLPWAEELLRYIFIWTCFMGTPVAFYYNDFSRFDMLDMKLKKNALKIFLTIIDILLLIMLIIMTIGSLTLVNRQMTQLATTLPIPMGIVYMAITISGIISAFFLLIKIGLRWIENRDFVLEEDN